MPAYTTLRERVRDALLAANFKARQDTIPGLLSGGTFDLISGAVIAVRVEWWDAPEAEKRALLESFAAALGAAGFQVHDRGDVLYVEEPPKTSSDEERYRPR